MLIFIIIAGLFYLAGCNPDDPIVVLPEITMNGDAEITIYVDEEYVELGATLTQDYGLTIETVSDVDNTTPGTYHVTYSVTYLDETISATRTVIVIINSEVEDDIVIPVVTLNGNATVYLEYGAIYTDLGAEFSDNLDLVGTVIVGGDTVDTSALGTYVVTYQATDSSGNVSLQIERNVIVQDTTSPVITLNGDDTIHVEYGETYDELSATFADNYDTTGTIIVGGDTVDVNVLGTYTVTYNVADSQENQANEMTRTVIVEDTVAPILTLVGYNTLFYDYQTVYLEATANFSDNYDSDGSVVVGGDTVDTSILGSYYVTYDAVDSSGNAAIQLTRTIIVTDLTKPVITLNGEATVYVEYGEDYVELSAEYTDNYDASGSVTNITGVVDLLTLGSNTVTYRFTDTHDNVATVVTRTVIVEDTTGPTIELEGDYIIYVNLGNSYTEPGANFYDNYDQDGTVIIGGDVVDTDTLGDYIITYNATDSSGNHTFEVTRTVSVVNSEPSVETVIHNYQPHEIGISFDYIDDYLVSSEVYIRLMKGLSQVAKLDVVAGHNTFVFDTEIEDNYGYTIEIWATFDWMGQKVYSTTFMTPPDISLDTFDGSQMFFSLDDLVLEINLNNPENYDIDFVSLSYVPFDEFEYLSDNHVIYLNMGAHPSGDYNFSLTSVTVTVNDEPYTYTFNSDITVHVYLDNEVDPQDATMELLDITSNETVSHTFISIPDSDTTVISDFYFYFDNPYDLIITTVRLSVNGYTLVYSNFDADNLDPYNLNQLVLPIEISRGNNSVYVLDYSFEKNGVVETCTYAADRHHFQTYFYGFNVTDPDIVFITSVGEFATMVPTGKYVLLNDLDLEGAFISPVGVLGNGFTGFFDGNGHTVSNFNISESLGESAAQSYVGVFGFVDGGFIADLTIENADIYITSTDSNNSVMAGILVGYLGGFGMVINSDIIGSSSVHVSGVKGGYFGGMLGYVQSGYIKDLNVNVSISILPDYLGAATGYLVVGGLIGVANFLDIYHSSATGLIDVGLADETHVGGLIGTIENDGSTSSYNFIYNSFANVDITNLGNSSYGNTGGLVGFNTGKIYNSFALGDLTVTSDYVGYIGGNQSYLTEYNYFNNYYYGDIVVTKNGVSGVGTWDMNYDVWHLRAAGMVQFSDQDFYTDIVGLNPYYFDFTFINMANDEFPRMN